MRRLIQTETGVRAFWELTSAGRRLQFHNGIRELIGQFPTGSYLLRTVHPESDTTMEYLPPVFSNQPDSGTRLSGQTTCLERHHSDYISRISRRIVRRVGRGPTEAAKHDLPCGSCQQPGSSPLRRNNSPGVDPHAGWFGNRPDSI